MALYCVERDTEPNKALIHKVRCGSFDLSTLLGSGKISSLGDFDTAELALDDARKHHPDAVCCAECCNVGLKAPGEAADETSSSHENDFHQNLYHEVSNAIHSVRTNPQKKIPMQSLAKMPPAATLREKQLQKLPRRPLG